MAKTPESRKVQKNTTKATTSVYPQPYWKLRQTLKLQQKGKPADEKKAKKKELGKFFKEGSLSAPGHCENCGTGLGPTIKFHPRAHICHIVPKGKHGCPSVATHEKNKWYGCIDCHTFFDNGAPDEVAQMPIIPKLRERVKIFYDLIAPDEKRRVQLFLIPKSGKK